MINDPQANRPPEAVVYQMLDGFKITQALYAASKLSIFDVLHAGPQTALELAGAVGAHAPSLMGALREREAAVARIEAALAKAEQVPRKTAEAAPDLPRWIEEQLRSLHALLLSNPERTKTEFRRLNLELVWTPVEAEPRPYISVKGQCDLSALAFSVLLPAERGLGAVLDRSLERSDP